jgi:DNA primase
MIQQFINLYQNARSIHIIKPIDSEEYLAFIDKPGLEVRLVSAVKHLEYLPHAERYYPFFNRNKIFWLIPIDFPNGYIGGFILRSFTGKDYSTFTGAAKGQMLYGWHGFNGFKRGNPIILVEGVKDREYIARQYPFVLACLSSAPSASSINLIRGLTDKVILAFDNDDTGQKQTGLVSKKFKEQGCVVRCITPQYVKDWGMYYGRSGMERLLKISLMEVLSGMG